MGEERRLAADGTALKPDRMADTARPSAVLPASFSRSPISRIAWPVLLVAVSVAAGWWLWRLTDHGIGVGSDSAVYFAGARNLLGGKGFVWFGGDQLPRPINHYPPLYSAVLSLGLSFGLDAEDAARLLNVFLVAGSTFLVGLLAGLLAASWPAAILGALLFAASEETLAIHSWAMSDGLYLFLALVSVTSATWWLRQTERRLAPFLMWSSAALALLTRYAGVGLMAVPVAATLYQRRGQRKRLDVVAVWLALALMPAIAWLARNVVLTGSATNRRPGLFRVDPGWWSEVGKVLESWFVPGRVVYWLDQASLPSGLAVSLALAGLIGLAALLQSRSDNRNGGWRIWIPLGAWFAAHLVVICLSTGTSYPPPDVDTRNLAPVFAAMVVLAAATIGLLASGGSAATTLAAILIAMAVLGFKAYAARDVVQRLIGDGQGYTSAAWSRSPVVQALRELDPTVVYSNDIGAVYYFTGSYANDLPLRYDSITGRERAEYSQEYCLMRRRLRETGGALVLFTTVTIPEVAATESITTGLEPVMLWPDGGIYVDGGGPLVECAMSRRHLPGQGRISWFDRLDPMHPNTPIDKRGKSTASYVWPGGHPGDFRKMEERRRWPRW